MTFNKICISSGHGLHIRGASGSPVPPYLDEVDEARQVVNQVAEDLRERGVEVDVFHDDTSHSQNENLNTIVNHHNKQYRDIDVSVHFNAYQTTSKPMGVEVLYLTQQQLAAQVSAAIANVTGLPNRGAKKRTDLFFLNKTHEPAILIEVCFVDSSVDADVYRKKFTEICSAVADVLGGPADEVEVPPEATVPPEDAPDKALLLFQANHTGIVCTVFGGAGDPNDSAYDGHRISDTELGCALPYKWRGKPPPRVQVRNTDNGKTVFVDVVDVGPWNTDDEDYVLGDARPQAESGTDTIGRDTNLAGIDLTPGAAKAIGLEGKGNVSWAFVKMPTGEGEV